MALILNIETATKNCSVSIAKDGNVIITKELNDGHYSHAEKLHPFINDISKIAEIPLEKLDAIAVSKGPGSYTGLRIGVSAAKGLCFAFDKPLISVETLHALATSVQETNSIIIPMLDARRMEVYSAVYNTKHEQLRTTEAEIINETSFLTYLNTSKVIFLGDGASKCKPIITHPNAFFIDDKFPSAKDMAGLSYEKYKKNDIEDVAYFEPFYLKDFMVTPQKKR